MLHFRLAKTQDLSLVLPLAESFHREDGHPLAATGASSIAVLLAGSPLGEVYLVEEDGILGYFALCFTMSLEFGGLVVILDDLYLKQEARGAGRGGRILDFVQAVARERGAVQVFLEVEHANERALALYKRAGWRIRRRHMLEKNLK